MSNDPYLPLSVEDFETLNQCLHNYGTRSYPNETAIRQDFMHSEGYILIQLRAKKWWIKQRPYLAEQDQISIDYLLRFFAV